jgi:hypothetical protein
VDRRIIEEMAHWLRVGRSPRLTTVAVALYALCLVVAQFEHHDLLCHLKTPQHCTSCASTQLGTDTAAPVSFGTLRLADVGSAIQVQIHSESVLLARSSSGRSPPPIA